MRFPSGPDGSGNVGALDARWDRAAPPDRAHGRQVELIPTLLKDRTFRPAAQQDLVWIVVRV
jgi:hypothetical protein